MALDEQILVAGTAALPVSYSVPNSGDVIPLAVAATFDGTAASGPFVPAVEVYSAGGVLIARGIASTEVAAGGSAAVTFAPGLDAAVGVALSSGSVPIAASGAGSLQLVAAVTGRRIQVTSVGLMAAGPVGVKFVATADLTGIYPLIANTGFVLGPQPLGRYWFQTGIGEALSINLSLAVNVGGVLNYVID